LYHQFWAEESRVLVGEVSTVNDDTSDNKFLDPIGRFTSIDEDEPPHRLLITDYAKYYQPLR
jgi:D-lyxose ketol-isomerase